MNWFYDNGFLMAVLIGLALIVFCEVVRAWH